MKKRFPILVVDDDIVSRTVVQKHLLKADFEVSTAANGKEAVAQVASLKPDVVTMDIEMPVMDGITAVRQIMAATPTPVLMFSSLTKEGAQATLDALEAGAVEPVPEAERGRWRAPDR